MALLRGCLEAVPHKAGRYCNCNTTLTYIKTSTKPRSPRELPPTKKSVNQFLTDNKRFIYLIFTELWTAEKVINA
jgi:hypothetical protein